MEFTRDYLKSLIDGQVEESAQLEYKRAASLDRNDEKKKVEITKDVSAFANAAGGVLVYGIQEYANDPRKHLPEDFDPVNQSEYSREWLDQMILRIRPRIDGLKIHPVYVGPQPNDYCYVVEIPQSGTAHQATDGRYHKRSNFVTVQMADYEIRDVMNRQKHPMLSVDLKIRRDPFEGTAAVMVFLKNESSVMARYFCAIVDLPFLLGGDPVHSENGLLDEVDGRGCVRIRIQGGALHPLFPGDERRLDAKINCRPGLFHLMAGRRLESIDEIRVAVFADAMPKKTSTFDPKTVVLS